jgi:hypothetical protein
MDDGDRFVDVLGRRDSVSCFNDLEKISILICH